MARNIKQIKAVIRVYKQTGSYTQTAKIFKLPYSCIWKKVNNYYNTGRKGREKKYIGKERCDICRVRTEVLHHIDFDNTNDKDDNLQPLCMKCHKLIHSVRG